MKIFVVCRDIMYDTGEKATEVIGAGVDEGAARAIMRGGIDEMVRELDATRIRVPDDDATAWCNGYLCLQLGLDDQLVVVDDGDREVVYYAELYELEGA